MKIKKEKLDIFRYLKISMYRIGSYLNYQNFFPNGKEEEEEKESLELYDSLCFAELHSAGTRKHPRWLTAGLTGGSHES